MENLFTALLVTLFLTACGDGDFHQSITPIAIHYAQTTGPLFGLILKSGGEVVEGRYFYR
jgi:hypothetical protein